MYTFFLFTYDAKGVEIKTEWKFLPVDREPFFDILSNDKGRATGASDTRPFAIKEVWNLTIGGGTMIVPENRKNFLRMTLAAHRIVWRRKYKNSTIDTEFELVKEARFGFEYLESKRSLKKKVFTIVEKEETYYTDFEAFLERYEEIIEKNALW